MATATNENLWITSPGRDPLLCELAELLEDCSSKRQLGCLGCPTGYKCDKWWTGVCEHASHRTLTQEVFEKDQAKFTRLQAGTYGRYQPMCARTREE